MKEFVLCFWHFSGQPKKHFAKPGWISQTQIRCRHMLITVLNQTFYPDVVSSGQHLADLASSLAERGHEVTVVTSRRAYDEPGKVFAKREIWRGVQILRVFATGFGKRAKWRRACDFATFLCSCCWTLLFLRRQDLVIAMTSPPLVSFIGAWFSRLRGSQFCYWIMDLNPDEALAAGWLTPGSFAARLLESCSRFSLRHASMVVVLDHFMRKRILEKDIESKKISIIPPWSHDAEVRYDPEGRARFRGRDRPCRRPAQSPSRSIHRIWQGAGNQQRNWLKKGRSLFFLSGAAASSPR